MVKSMKSIDSGSRVRKFTKSCSRCRASKLKCDRKEPCIECTKRDIGHLCTKDERYPRAKRTKMGPSQKRTRLKSPVSETTVPEETAQVLEDIIEGASRANIFLSSASGSTLSTPAPDYPNLYWETTESRLQMKEITDAFPDSEMTHNLYEVFVTRCQGPLGNIFHTPTFLKHAGRICETIKSVSLDSHIFATSSTFSMEDLACFLMALVLGLAFHPRPNILGWSPTAMNDRVEILRSSNFHLSTWRSLALRCLRGRMGMFCASMASLQAALMLLLDGQHDRLELDSLLVTAISGAQKLDLHRLGDVKLDPLMTSSGDVDMPSHIRTELGIRICESSLTDMRWALVLRDWSRGHVLGYYTIHPSQFNTRIPLHINDEDLC
ncbi:hypothetical protein N7486_007823 [Penicillium sp. IBT 16267x]|nr:hypothetical protein N7486_007823 [Penicillium sp. IBT 16267x]